ncbi:zinc-binding dehydrogenase [Pseudomonas sp. AP3_22 TE3818]
MSRADQKRCCETPCRACHRPASRPTRQSGRTGCPCKNRSGGSLGCELSIDYRAQDILAATRQWAAEGVDLVLDCVGCGSLPGSLDLLRPNGMLVSILTLAEGDAGPNHVAAAQRGLRSAVTYSKMPSGVPLGKIAALLASGQAHPPRIEVLPLESAASAHDLLQSGNAHVKLVLQVSD